MQTAEVSANVQLVSVDIRIGPDRCGQMDCCEISVEVVAYDAEVLSTDRSGVWAGSGTQCTPSGYKFGKFINL